MTLKMGLRSIGNTNFDRYYKRSFTNSGCDANPYRIVFFDDFSESTLNTAYWKPYQNATPPLDQIWVCDDNPGYLFLPENAIVNYGMLHLKTTKLASPLSFECEDPEPPHNTITVTRKYSCGWVQTVSGPPGSQGCFQQGKFSIRAKIPNNVQNTIGAYWFFGWANELDVVEVCQPDCDEMQSNRWLYVKNPTQEPPDCNAENTQFEWPRDDNIGNIYAFRIYTLEWTPFKFVISVDGVVKRTFHRFYEIDGSGNITHPLECEDLPANQPTQVWEHIAWYTLFNHYMDLIMSVGIKNTGNSTAGGEMLVDWVKVEQRTSATVEGQGTTPDFICEGEQEVFQVGGEIAPNSILGWTVSSNLEIVSTNTAQGTVTVTPAGIVNSYPGPGWIEAKIANPACCLGHNIKKNIWAGRPATPQVSVYKTCNYILLNIENYSSDNTYQWQMLTNGFSYEVYNNGKNLYITISPPTQQPASIAYRLIATNPCGSTSIINGLTTLPCNTWRLNVYPNPTSTIANVELVNFTQDDLNQNLKIYLIDAHFNVKKSTPVTQLTETLDVSDVELGYHYIFTVVNGENVISDEFIIQH